jgi:hypothetical protein
VSASVSGASRRRERDRECPAARTEKDAVRCGTSVPAAGGSDRIDSRVIRGDGDGAGRDLRARGGQAWQHELLRLARLWVHVRCRRGHLPEGRVEPSLGLNRIHPNATGDDRDGPLMRTPSPPKCGLDVVPPWPTPFVMGTAPSLSACPSEPTWRWAPCSPKKCERWLQVRRGCVCAVAHVTLATVSVDATSCQAQVPPRHCALAVEPFFAGLEICSRTLECELLRLEGGKRGHEHIDEGRHLGGNPFGLVPRILAAIEYASGSKRAPSGSFSCSTPGSPPPAFARSKTSQNHGFAMRRSSPFEAYTRKVGPSAKGT